jgi:hypothetical protein
METKITFTHEKRTEKKKESTIPVIRNITVGPVSKTPP